MVGERHGTTAPWPHRIPHQLSVPLHPREEGAGNNLQPPSRLSRRLGQPPLHLLRGHGDHHFDRDQCYKS